MQIPQFGMNGGDVAQGSNTPNGNMAPSSAVPNNNMTPNGGMSASNMVPEGYEIVNIKKANTSSLIKIIAIVILSLMSVAFIGLFIWKNSQYVEVQTDVDGKIAVAVAEAKDEQALKDEEEFAEREKYPYRTFSGPADYGQLTFEYPKTWSVYIADNAANGGDFRAFLNPIEVEAESNETIYALRVEILDKAFDDVVKNYQKSVEKGEMSLEVINIADAVANKYTGKLPNTEMSGYIVVFKIRDKTVVLRTDSVLFTDDFNRVLSTITFNA